MIKIEFLTLYFLHMNTHCIPIERENQNPSCDDYDNWKRNNKRWASEEKKNYGKT